AVGGVAIVDEAGMIGTRDMVRLFEVMKQHGMRVVLVGDRKQNRSVAAGEPLKLLEQRAGLKVAEGTEVVRQKGDYKPVARALNQGRIADAFAQLDRLNWIREVPDGERDLALANAYLAATDEKKLNGEYKSALVVSSTHAEKNRITTAI